MHHKPALLISLKKRKNAPRNSRGDHPGSEERERGRVRESEGDRDEEN